MLDGVIDCAPGEVGQRPSAALVEVPYAVPGQTVLVIEDEPTLRVLIAELLADRGYTTIEAADGTAGLAVLRSDVRIDLLVTDLGLPGLNGRQVADAALGFRPGLKVLFITGHAGNVLPGGPPLDPGLHVLSKPFALRALANRVKDLIGRQEP